jgi:hypothetical protein
MSLRFRALTELVEASGRACYRAKIRAGIIRPGGD